MMAQQARRPRHLADEDDDTISISIKGDKLSVARLIAAMAQVMNGEHPQAAPEEEGLIHADDTSQGR